MGIHRRQVLKGLAAAAAAGGAGLPSLEILAASLKEETPHTPLIWVTYGEGSHNHLAMLGQRVPSFLDLVATQWNVLDYDPVMPTGFAPTTSDFAAAPVIVLEAIPERGDGDTPVVRALREVLPAAKAAILLGTDACYGGVRASRDAPGRVEALCKQVKTPLIKLPGVPVPPHHLLGVLNHLELSGFPPLDSLRRPTLFYAETVCSHCERRGALETGQFANYFGEEGCLLQLGCKGPITHNTCSTARWNDGANWCVGAGGPCTGCSEPGYPYHGGLGLAGRLTGGMLGEQSALLSHVEGVGLAMVGVAGAGVAVHLARRMLAPPGDEGDPPGGRG